MKGPEWQWGRRGQTRRKARVSLPTRLHRLILLRGGGVGFAFVTGFCDARGLLIDCASSCYHDGAHELDHHPHRPSNFVSVDGVAFACPFPSAPVCVLFFHDACGPFHCPLMKMKQKRNDPVYDFCAILSLALGTYRENELAVMYLRRVINAHSSRAGARGEGGQMLKVLLTRCCRRLEKL